MFVDLPSDKSSKHINTQEIVSVELVSQSVAQINHDLIIKKLFLYTKMNFGSFRNEGIKLS